MVIDKYTTSSHIESTITVIEKSTPSDKLIDTLINEVVVSDFTETWGESTINQEVDYKGFLLSYNVHGSFERSEDFPSGWHTKHSQIEVHDLILFNDEGEEMSISEQQKEKLTEQIENCVEL